MHIGVVGLGFGDEGKGLATSYLCNLYGSSNSVVIRSNGGHQAGHTVVYKGHRHVFSQFGSGTLQGISTFLSSFCTVHPHSLLKEYELLKEFKPNLYIDPLAMITTPWDVAKNHIDEDDKMHGSVGVGFGTTIERHESYFKLYFQDLFHEEVLRAKLNNIIRIYYGCNLFEYATQIEDFVASCKVLTTIAKRMTMSEIDFVFSIKIYEGAQGILLDKDFGFFPNVTRSNTTCKNMMTLSNNALEEVLYVTRSYQTRHGNGFMTNEDANFPLVNNEKETNIFNKYQGKLRIGALDPKLIRYALDCDKNFHPREFNTSILVTCQDQHKIDVNKLILSLDHSSLNGYSYRNLYESYGPEFKDVITY